LVGVISSLPGLPRAWKSSASCSMTRGCDAPFEPSWAAFGDFDISDPVGVSMHFLVIHPNKMGDFWYGYLPRL
jgi:hypothetical protein